MHNQIKVSRVSGIWIIQTPKSISNALSLDMAFKHISLYMRYWG